MSELTDYIDGLVSLGDYKQAFSTIAKVLDHTIQELDQTKEQLVKATMAQEAINEVNLKLLETIWGVMTGYEIMDSPLEEDVASRLVAIDRQKMN